MRDWRSWVDPMGSAPLVPLPKEEIYLRVPRAACQPRESCSSTFRLIESQTVMAPAIIEAGPASGPEVLLETKKVPEQNANSTIDPKHEEYQYLHLIRDILDQGEHRPDR